MARKPMPPLLDSEGNPIARCVHDDLKHVACPQCKQIFRLTWNEWEDQPDTLVIRACPSGGIYDVEIHCPHCNYEEPL